MAHTFVSPKQAGKFSSLAFQQCDGQIWKVFYFLFWEERRKGFDRVQVSLSEIQKGAKVCRDTAVRAIAWLEGRGLLRKIRDWFWVWIDGVRHKRQATNVYVFLLPPESDQQTVPFGLEKSLPSLVVGACGYVDKSGRQEGIEHKKTRPGGEERGAGGASKGR